MVQAADPPALPPAPADGIWDDTRALTPDQRARLATAVAELRVEHGVSVWVVAETFLPQGTTPRDRARQLRQAWSPAGAAVLFLYDRSSDREMLSYSPDLWSRLPSAGLFHLHQSLHETMQQRSLPLEKRMEQCVQRLLSNIATLSSQQGKLDQVQGRDFFRLGRVFGAGLVLLAVVFWAWEGWQRRRQQRVQPLGRLPKVVVNPRLGAPHGSTVLRVE